MKISAVNAEMRMMMLNNLTKVVIVSKVIAAAVAVIMNTPIPLVAKIK